MAWHLYRLGRWSFRHRKTVIGFWIGLLLLMGVGATTLSGKTTDEFSLPGIESAKAFDLIKERTPQAAPDGATARIVFQAPKGENLNGPEHKAAVDAVLESVKTPNVLTVQSPYEMQTITKDGRTGYASVSYEVPSAELAAADREALDDASGAAAGLRVEVGGDALQQTPETGVTEFMGVAVALVVLVITLGSMLAAGMPLLTALVGVGIGVAGITAATGFLELGSTTPILATMLGLAVGIDYALFIVSRYRHEIMIGREPEDAAGRAIGTAGSAVIFAGLTVIIALVGLSIVNIPFLTEMGLAAGITVLVAVMIALTMLPALFGFAGAKILAGKIPFLRGRDPEDASDKPTAGRSWANFVTHHRISVLVVGVIAAGAMAVPLASMQLALPDDGSAAKETSARQAYDLIAENFGAGTNGPLLVVVDTADAANPKAAVDAVVEKVGAVKSDVARVISPKPQDPTDAAAMGAYDGQLTKAQYAIITVLPKSGPSDAATQNLVHDIRQQVEGTTAATGAEVLVTGQTAVGVDVSQALSDAFPRYLIVVVGLAFILLTMVFRSIWVPLKAVAGFMLSVGIALGATVAVFQWGWAADLVGVDQAGPIMSMLPLLLVGILFGLAMDYEVFLVSRMREEFVHGRSGNEAVVRGFQYSARVVAAAAVIMIGVFGSFAFSVDPIIKSIGFGLAVGILADAFLVRMTLVPAVMALLGDRAWWLPNWLDRLVPNLDIEGERLQHRLASAEEASELQPV